MVADFFLRTYAKAIVLLGKVVSKFEVRRKFCLDAVQGFVLSNFIPQFFQQIQPALRSNGAPAKRAIRASW